VEILIDEVSEAALEAIEQAAGEAARAAVLSVIEREAEAIRQVHSLQMEVKRLRNERVTHIVITALACLVGGFCLGFSF
jgi:ABC-type proline/glycine betaine transport system permease subunit